MEIPKTVNEVTDVTTYVGTSSPMDFNGLVRHYYLRRGPNVADIRVNLLEKKHRSQQSHALLLRLRPRLKEIATRTNGKAFSGDPKTIEEVYLAISFEQ